VPQAPAVLVVLVVVMAEVMPELEMAALLPVLVLALEVGPLQALALLLVGCLTLVRTQTAADYCAAPETVYQTLFRQPLAKANLHDLPMVSL
jgi:hypothetical protein